MSDAARLTQTLVSWALDAGFDRAGVADLRPSEHADHLRAWLARGDHADMAWIERRVPQREDPAQLLPGARCALCVTLQYAPLVDEDEAEGDLWPRVARYARGRDYHDVMGKRLRQLAARIQDAFPGAGTRPYVDTGPILERELAARAGLGALAKNTMLLHRQHGSYFLLGEILLTLDAAPSVSAGGSTAASAAGSAAAIADPCGRCTRCLDACPTGALTAPYQLDSRRCISYWTIEHRGTFPSEIRPQLGDWVFGCDICQEVCPYNRRPRPGDEDTMRLPAARSALDLAALATIDRDTYVERFRHSPMKRAKQPGLQRNAVVAMGNRGSSYYLPALRRALDDEQPMVRRHAAWALGRIGGARALEALHCRSETETDPAVRAEIEAAKALVDDDAVSREIG